MPNVARPRHRAGIIAFSVISGCLFLGGGIPLLVDFAAGGGVGWALFPLGAVSLAWAVIAPFFLARRHRAAGSWAAGMVGVPLYLALVHGLVAAKGWLMPLALPAAGLGLAAWGAVVWLWRYSRIRPLYAAALTLVLLALLTVGEEAVVLAFVGADPYAWIRRLVALCLAGGAGLTGIVALAANRTKFLKE
jgi:hypothetical protein